MSKTSITTIHEGIELPLHVVLCEETPYDLIKCFKPVLSLGQTDPTFHPTFTFKNIRKFGEAYEGLVKRI